MLTDCVKELLSVWLIWTSSYVPASVLVLDILTIMVACADTPPPPPVIPNLSTVSLLRARIVVASVAFSTEREPILASVTALLNKKPVVTPIPAAAPAATPPAAVVKVALSSADTVRLLPVVTTASLLIIARVT